MIIRPKSKLFLLVVLVALAIGAGLLFLPKKIDNSVPNPSPTPSNRPEAIEVTSPKPNEQITSPLKITGQARGTWFFEASFPVMLVDWDGLIIAQGIATAQGDWMTENFVPFTATLTFTKPAYKNNGTLILKKDNPSGLPQYDAAYEIPIIFKSTAEPVACTMEAMQCPDGSYVGRTGPNCEFTACPSTQSSLSGIEGRVTVGPTCPLQKIPPDPACEDKPFQGLFKVTDADSQKEITQFTSGSDGKFKVSLNPGNYLVELQSGKAYPRIQGREVTVEKNKFTTINFVLDSGIR